MMLKLVMFPDEKGHSESQNNIETLKSMAICSWSWIIKKKKVPGQRFSYTAEFTRILLTLQTVTFFFLSEIWVLQDYHKFVWGN